jgi:predicted dehydrogenase
MNGVTGRMGTNQHLIRSILAIRAEGGVRLANGERLMPDPILVGRNAEKVSALAKAHGVERWTTDLDAALANRADTIFFDAATTQMRPALLQKAIAAGKHVYCEKPVATNLGEALDLVRAAKAAGIKHGVVQDKLWLPGLRKLKMLIDSGFFGRIFAVRGEFGYWVFEGDPASLMELPQRRGRGDHPRHALPLALCARQHFRRGEKRLLPGRNPHPRTLGRKRKALPGDRRRRGIRQLRVGRGNHRAHQ